MCRASRRLLSGALEILDRLGDVVAVGVVMGEFRQMVVESPCVDRFDRIANPLVPELAALYQQRVVSDLLRQRMLEDVFYIARGWLLVDELARLQVGEHRLQL